ncbi:MAG: hypothetical protein GX076_01000 [Clostridiales bacterium]|nr:hypothetical protein [Clostridiales bacterium]
MVGILSIDFDYFIEASFKEREIYFPKGSDEIPKDKLKAMWKERYFRYPKLKEVGVIDEYYFLKKYLKLMSINKNHFCKSYSHKSIKKVIDKIPKGLQIKIVNIDFHHDYYHYYNGDDSINCSNWLRRVIEERPDTEVKWIRREDSQIYSLEGRFPFEHTTDIKEVINEKFNFVFICRSPEWSPPHLSDKFEELAMSIFESKIA